MSMHVERKGLRTFKAGRPRDVKMRREPEDKSDSLLQAGQSIVPRRKKRD